MEASSVVINIGSRVEVILHDRAGTGERLHIILVPAEAADYAHGFLGVNTPLAQAMIGEKAGTVIPYLKDDIYSIEIVSVARAEIDAPMDAVRKRDASLKKTMREVEDTSAMVFASSFSGKWGDYDPDSLPQENKSEEQEDNPPGD